MNIPGDNTPAAGTPRSDQRSGVGVPAADRRQRPGWRDPRIWIGVAIMAASILLGVRVLAAADNTVGVWVLGKDLPAGARVQSSDLEQIRVRFTSSTDADRYLSADDPLPKRSVLQRAVDRGELLPRSALSGGTEVLEEVPVAAEIDAVPETIAEGSVVDVWVTPQAATTSDKLADAQRVLDDVVVIKAPTAEDTLAPSGTRQIIVGVTPRQARELGPALGRTASGRVVITKQG